MRRARRLLPLGVAAVFAAALLWWATRPAPLSDEERALVGGWAKPSSPEWVTEFRADRTVRFGDRPNLAYRWRVRGGVLRYTEMPPPPPTAGERVLRAVFARPLAHEFSLRWAGPDSFRQTSAGGRHVHHHFWMDAGGEPEPYTRLPPRTSP